MFEWGPLQALISPHLGTGLGRTAFPYAVAQQPWKLDEGD
jgi:hypothetical protein